MIRLEGVTKCYQRGREMIVAVDHVDLLLQAGQMVGLMGPSGSGKSTLLHIIGGLDQPDSGEVYVEGVRIDQLKPGERAQLRRRRIGFVFQFFYLIPSLSVAENVELPLLLDRVRLRSRRVEELLDQLEIRHRAAHLPAELSGGEMQRVAIARALVARPSLVLADEPTGNLDSATGSVILDVLVEAVRASEATLLMATHDESAAARADRILHLRDGRLAEPHEAPRNGAHRTV
jgi:putative ABC transport system ATP-binding protein